MATKAVKNSRTSSSSTKKKTSTRKRKVSPRGSGAKESKRTLPQTKAATATGRYLDDLTTRGEAQELDKKGKLPLDATHAIVGKDKDGKPIVRRARFKTY